MAGQADILFRAEVDATGAITALKALSAEAGAVGTKAGSASSGVAGFAGSISSLKSVIGGAAVTAGLYKLSEWMSETIRLAGEASLEQVKLEAMLRATGGAVGMTADELDSMAVRLSRVTGVEDELVKSAESLLLTFRNVRGDAFEPTMKAAADLAAVTGMDLRAAVETLGRALEDPASGMDRLRRVGIIFSDQVKAQIKDLQEHGRQLEAQNLLLAQVQQRVGGVADAMGGTFVKSLEKVRNEWSNVREELGGFISDSKDGVGILGDLALVLGKVADGIKGIRSEDKAKGQAAGGGLVEILTSMVPGMGGAVGSLQQLATVLSATAEKIRETDVAATKLVSSHGALGGAMNNLAHLSDAEKKQLEALLNTLDPVRKATSDYNENVKLLGEALAAHEITQGQYNDALAASKEALDKVRQATGLLLPEMAKLPGTNTLAGLSAWGDAIRNVEENYRDLLPKVTSLARSWEAGLSYTSWIIDLDLSTAKKQALNFSDEMAKDLGNAFKDGFLKAFQNDDTLSAWKALSNGFAGMFADSLGKTLSALMQGKPLTGEGGALEMGGLWSKDKGFNWQTALGDLGGAVGSYGIAKNNQGLGALGGAMSGAAAGMAFGPWGAAIGAVIGGLMGFFSAAGPKKMGYNLAAGSGLGYGEPTSLVDIGYGGPDTATMADWARQIHDTSLSTEVEFRSLLTAMGQGVVNPAWSTTSTGKTADPSTLFTTFLKSAVPSAIFGAYKPYLQTGLSSLGVSDTRAAQELAGFDKGKFDAALQAFKDWVSAITSLGDVSKLLGQTPEELRDTVNRSLRDSFLAGFEDVMKQAGDLTKNVDQLFSKEQVANAQQLLGLAQNQYQAGLQYFQQMEQISQSIAQQTTGVLAGFDEARAGEKGQGQLASYYESQLNALQGQLGGATSAEQVNTIMAAILQYGQKLWGLQGGENQPRNVMSRADIETFIKQAQQKAQEEIAAWEKEVADKNKELKDEVDLMTEALKSGTNATGELGDTAKSTGDALAGLGDSAASAGGALADLVGAASNLAAAFGAAASDVGQSAAQAAASLSDLPGATSGASQRYA